MLGMASGIFIVPILTMLCHVDLRDAIGASIVSVIACSCGSAAAFLKERLTNVRLAIVLETATTAGALTGVFLAGRIPNPFLFFLFGTILLLSALQMLAKRNDPVSFRTQALDHDSRVRELDSTYRDREVGLDIAYRVEHVPIGLILMYVAGLISALLGIGSGVLKVPAMDTALRLPIKVSSETSNFMICVTAAASAGAYFARGEMWLRSGGLLPWGPSLALSSALAYLYLFRTREFACCLRPFLSRLRLKCFLRASANADARNAMDRKTTETEGHIEAVLARALAFGTWLISAVISAGLALSSQPGCGMAGRSSWSELGYSFCSRSLG
jgi:uncharacterized protein